MSDDGVKVPAIPTVPKVFARRVWHKHAVDLMQHLFEKRTALDLRQFTRDVPLIMAMNTHMAAWGVSVALDTTNRDFIFYAPDGSPLDRMPSSYLLYRRVIQDQNAPSILKFWDV